MGALIMAPISNEVMEKLGDADQQRERDDAADKYDKSWESPPAPTPGVVEAADKHRKSGEDDSKAKNIR